MIKKDLLSQLLYEAQAYNKFEDIEKLVESGGDLSMIPIQPLFVSLQNTSKDQFALILPKLSHDQRQALRDIDLWQKDIIDPEAANFWLEVYSKCPDEDIQLEFIKSEDFLLSIKNQLSISTFDVEDPLYPDDDNYFLTEDNQLLIAYPDDFSLASELKEMIRKLYSDLGVEHAYIFLFKMIVDSYQIMEENNYQQKKERLRDFGFVDYFESLEYNACFLNFDAIDLFIKNKKTLTPQIDSLSLNQSLHSTSLVAYQASLHEIKEALNDVKSETRAKFLHFNFIRLVNARMSFIGALKSGSLAMTKIGHQTRSQLELGFEYVIQKRGAGENIFEIFDFFDLFKVGHSLIEINQKKLKKILSSTPFEKDDFSYFLGMYWNSFLEHSYSELPAFKFDGSSKPQEINNLKTYKMWLNSSETFIQSLPFIESFFSTLEKLKSDNLLNDQFYLNYEVDNIDFEAIMISSFINFCSGHLFEESRGKMGVSVSELKVFFQTYFIKNGAEFLIKGIDDSILKSKTQEFLTKFGLSDVHGFAIYIYQILVEQLNGYEIDVMSEEEFKHIGGPILLNTVKN